MRLNDKQVWYDFAYNLLFPAVLGSMIYDVADARQRTFSDENYWFKLLILAFYCLDYLFLYHDLKRPPDKRKASEIVMDVFIALAYRVAFSFAQLENYRRALLTFVVILLAICLYLNRTLFERVYFRILLGIMTVAVVYSRLSRDHSDAWYHFVPLAAVFVAYLIYVFALFDRFVKEKGKYNV